MKKVLVLLVMLLTFNLSNAQNDYFTLTQIKGKSMMKTINIEAQYIVEFEGKTSIEISQGVELAVGRYWVNPNEVIDGKVDGKYLKINGGAKTRYDMVLLTPFSYPTKISIIFNFKDGKMMYQLLNYTHYISPSQYTSGGYYPVGELMTRKNGNEVKYAKENVEGLNNFIDGFIDEIKKSIESGAGENSDW